MDELFGFIERITFQNQETGYTVAQLKAPKQADLICIVGNLGLVQPGETIRCFGQWKTHLIHGRQFVVERCQAEAPADVLGIKKYLSSGLVKGIGATFGGRIVDRFGVETLRVIDQTPERLLEIPGIGKKRVDLIIQCWSDQKSIRDVMIFLQGHGVTPSYAQKIFKVYGNRSAEIVKTTPYKLAQDVHGIGFQIADQIASNLGIAKDSSQRVDAGVEYVLSELMKDGHVCYPVAELLKAAEEQLQVPADFIKERLSVIHQEERVELFDLVWNGTQTPFAWIRPLFYSEIGIARELKRLCDAPGALRPVDEKRALAWVQEKLNITLAENQKIGVTISLGAKVHILTGGPGTGKSTITNAILTITNKLTNKIILAAPTGRAAKRMQEITGKKAFTIHSLLEFSFQGGGFKRNRENPLDCDLLIVDEASMIDTYLMYSLLKAIPSTCRLILVGDIHQLPSVGPGNVLRDIIQSRCVPVTQLKEIYRQAAGSQIVTNAHRINQGVFPEVRNQSDSDFFFLHADEPEAVLKTILQIVTQRIPQKYGFNAIDDIQVLAPMKRGVIGIENLNYVLQQALNKNDAFIHSLGRKFAVGDKVMQIRNNYKKEVFNGDIGRIIEIDQGEQSLLVDVEGRSIEYEFNELDELVLAYAASIHKYQGSECPCVVIPVHTTHFKMLHRNLLYTGVTRGKKLVILVGNMKALAIAVHNDEVKQRYTGLQQALVGTHTNL